MVVFIWSKVYSEVRLKASLGPIENHMQNILRAVHTHTHVAMILRAKSRDVGAVLLGGRKYYNIIIIEEREAL